MKTLFRSWNKTDSQYYYFENGKYYELSEGNKVHVEEHVFNWDNAEQYTGLDDIKGNNIFSGFKSLQIIDLNKLIKVDVLMKHGEWTVINNKKGRCSLKNILSDKENKAEAL